LIERQSLLERLGLIFAGSPRFNSAQVDILRERFALKQTSSTAEYENIAKEITCLNGGKAVEKRVVQSWVLRNASMIRRNKSNKARGANKFLLRQDPASSGEQEKAGSQKEQIEMLSSKDNEHFGSDGDVDKTGGDFAGSDDACNGSEVHSSKKKPSVNEDDFEEQEEEAGEEKEEEDDDKEEEFQEKEEGQGHRADSAVVDKRPRIEQKSVKERQDVASARLSQAAKLDLLSKKESKEKACSDEGRDEGGAKSSNLFKRGDAVIAQYENGLWYAAVVCKHRSDGQFLLMWLDNDSNDRVKSARCIRPRPHIQDQGSSIREDDKASQSDYSCSEQALENKHATLKGYVNYLGADVDEFAYSESVSGASSNGEEGRGGEIMLDDGQQNATKESMDGLDKMYLCLHVCVRACVHACV